ncbi:MAG: FAD-dependent oxidoreductase [Clostridia bacterium]|nr:FAD-dependent oxidoreductase [Clostridia bacterium]
MAEEKNMYDVIIVGGGPAGLSAAIYLARAKYKVLVMEKDTFGGQITITAEIVNYPGVYKTSGKELTEKMRLQGEAFGAEFVKTKAEKLDLTGDIKVITTEDGKEYRSLGVVLALGASPRRLGFDGEETFKGRGVAYCATCDGEFFTGREVLVVGGGFAAAEEAMFLTKYAKKVTILVRGDAFTCAQSVVDKLETFPSIEVRYNTEVVKAVGGATIESAVLKNNKTSESYTFTAEDGGTFGIFVFVGYAPATEPVKGQVELNPQGYIVTDVDRKTSLDGVYAAGDVCIKNLRQVVTAVSDGATAATSLEKHVSTMHEKLNLPAFAVSGKNGDMPEEKEEKAAHAESSSDSGSFLSGDVLAQLLGVLDRFARPVEVVAVLSDEGGRDEISGFVDELTGVHPNLKTAKEEGEGPSYMDIRAGGQSYGIRFYSIPGGHEFNSFVIAMYNVAGPGQAIEPRLKERIEGIKGHHTLQVMATLSCTNCPTVVMGTQRIASLNPGVTAEMYDLSKFPDIKTKYNIMAVPCLVVDGVHTHFGKHSLEELVEIVEKYD